MIRVATVQCPPAADRRSRVWLSAVVLAWGMQAIVTQSILLREAFVLMFGSELAWGIVLSAWLAGVAVGSWLAGWAVQRWVRAELGLTAVLTGLCVVSCAELWLFRGARASLGVAPGEFLPLTATALAAIALVSPAGVLIGAAFPFACRVTTDGSIGRVYALESAGSLVGGAAFSFWAVEHVAPIESLLACCAITLAALSGLVRSTPAAVLLGVTSAGALLVAVLGGDVLDQRLVERRWRDLAPGYELCAEADSRYQNLAVGGRENQYTLYSNGQVVSDFPDPYTFVPRAHTWMCQHPAPGHVLVLGGGVEGLLAEILLHPIEHVDYVEPDPRQTELIRPFLSDADREALTDSRVTVHTVDTRYFVKTQTDRFDLVIARLPEPMSALGARLYTREFYGELRRSMTARSVLCMTAGAMPAQLSAASAEYLASIRATLQTHFPHVTIGWGDPAQVLAATVDGLVTTDPTELVGRYERRGVESKLFRPAWFDGATDWLDPEKVRMRAAELDAVQRVEVSTDLRPAIYMQRLALWERMSGEGARGIVARLRSVGLAELIGALVSVGVAVLLVCRLRRGAVVLSIGSTGFVTMALSIVWLFAFQNLYGHVYQRIGWIVALFMGGLAAGSWIASRGDTANAAWRLVLVDASMAVLSMAAPLALSALGGLQTGPLALTLVECGVSVMVALTGVLGGAAFALAGAVRFGETGCTGSAAGLLFGADHAGACLGAMLCGILLVPVFGTAAAAMLLAGIKFASAALVGGAMAHTLKR